MPASIKTPTTRPSEVPGLSIELAGELLTLLPDRAMHWPARKTLFVADTHWGKGATFRAASIPIPGGTMQKDLDRLSHLIHATQAERMIVLGDLVHARQGQSPQVVQAVSQWRNNFSQLAIDVICGNHDQKAGPLPAEWSLSLQNGPVILGPFALQHFPDAHPTHYVLAGHLHPAIRLQGPARESIRLACFHATAEVLTLPAFCSFAGAAIIKPMADDRVYAIADNRVFQCEFAEDR